MNILIQLKYILSNGFHTLFVLVPDLPVYVALVIFLFGTYKTFLSGTGSHYIKVLTEYMKTPSEGDVYFTKIGSKITANKYTIMLYTVSFAIFISCSIISVVNGNVRVILLGLLLAILMVVLLRPKAYIYKNFKSLFIVLIEFSSKRRKEELDKELFNSITTLKNLAIAQEDDAISADLMIEKLMDNSKKLKPIYAQTLSIYRSGNKSAALNFFSESIGTKNGKTFALTLEKLDKIDPYELKTQVLSLQEIIEEERFTKGLEKAENKGTLIYALATGVCFVCLLNFLFVCVLMDTMASLGDMF